MTCGLCTTSGDDDQWRGGREEVDWCSRLLAVCSLKS